jgi:hypothetical protein
MIDILTQTSYRTQMRHFTFQVLTAIWRTICFEMWSMRFCRSLFLGTMYCLRLQGRRMGVTRMRKKWHGHKKLESSNASSKRTNRGIGKKLKPMRGLFFAWIENWEINGSTRLHGTISRKTVILIVTTIRNWVLTKMDVFTVCISDKESSWMSHDERDWYCRSLGKKCA